MPRPVLVEDYRRAEFFGPELAPEIEYKILELRRDGVLAPDIATALNVTYNQVRAVINHAATECRAKNLQLRQEAFLFAHERIEYWYKKVKDRIENDVDSKNFLDGVKVLLALLARQSAMLALDNNMEKVTAGSGNRTGMAWWDDPNCSPDKLVAAAKQIGLKVPSSFVHTVMQ
jgi:hypothetical protein